MPDARYNKKKFEEIQTDTKILLVEDNLVNCEIALDMLELLGVSVDIAHDGQQALALFKINQYQLILMDCEMPVMDGYTATRQIRDSEQQSVASPQSIPIIALTAHSLSSIKENFNNCGMDDLLSKPFDLPALKSIIEYWLNRSVTELSDPAQSKESAHYTCIGDINSDWDVLDYKTINNFYIKQQKKNSNLLTKLVSIYIEQSNALLDQLTAASANNDIESIRIIAHTLKSSSVNIGALALSEVCRSVELKCDRGHIDEMLVQKIHQDYADVKNALNAVMCSIDEQASHE